MARMPRGEKCGRVSWRGLPRKIIEIFHWKWCILGAVCKMVGMHDMPYILTGKGKR